MNLDLSDGEAAALINGIQDLIVGDRKFAVAAHPNAGSDPGQQRTGAEPAAVSR
jgi:hypothetical protein